MQSPETVQQQLLHLYGHRHLLKQSMLHKNLDQCLGLLPGSFAGRSLLLSYTSFCIENRLDVPEEGNFLYDLVHNWVKYYPTLRGRKKILIS
jgi:hypothetical protein